MTNKLYYISPYTTEWETEIRKTVERDHSTYVILKETAFYPHGGGQPSDKGSINGIPVLDVFTEEEEVFHLLERLPESKTVSCRLDWDRRFDHMQHHSGQHLLSAVCRNLYEAKTVSFHLGHDYVTIDVDRSDLSKTDLEMIEQEANRQIYKNRKIKSYFVTNEEMKQLTLAKIPKVTENIRIVEIEGIEHNACGGTHVSHTGEIGMIKLFKTEKQKGATRIFFKCGYRALKNFNDSLDVLGSLSLKFNTGRNDIIDRVVKWEMEHNRLESEVDHLKEQCNAYLVQELLTKAKNGFLAHIFEGKPFNDIKDLALKTASENDIIVLFAALEENKILLAHDGTRSLSCGKFLKEHLPAFNGKGGGSEKSAQAGFPSREDTIGFFHFTKEKMSNIY
jgi:alanyl-tRNA synthetase